MRREAVAQGAEIAADDEQGSRLERGDPVENRVSPVERRHDAADALDEVEVDAGRGARELHELVEGYCSPFACRRHVGR